MTLRLPFTWSDACLLHEPAAEVWVGTRTPATEVPARAAVDVALTAVDLVAIVDIPPSSCRKAPTT